LTPIVDGEVYHYVSRGLYNGVSILWDRETGSVWDHITGEAMYGPSVGHWLPIYNLLHTNAAAALEADPELRIAISDRPIRQRGNFLDWVMGRFTSLSERFERTIAKEDKRRPTLEVGIGLWTENVARYYSMEDVLAAGEAISDELDGRRLVVYVEPRSRALGALYAETGNAEWVEGELRLDDGVVLREGRLYGSDGARLEIERPLQLFTRWYGFALTFPGTEIYGE
jgi:hypothetical protein